MGIFCFALLLAGFPAFMAFVFLGGPKGSIYLHILGITIPLIVKSPVVVLSLEQKRSRGICCDRYKRTKTNHSPSCRKEKRIINSGIRNGVKWECGV